MPNEIIDRLITCNTSKIILLVMDGLGGCSMEPGGPTELQAARTPHLDRLASLSACGLMDPVYPGVTPGSGPAHLSLFGYDPVAFNIGRGVLEALGINFPLESGDIAARINLATIGSEGAITDRRAGRISTEENENVCRKLRGTVQLPKGVEWFIETVKEHRAVLVLRGKGLDDAILDTDPQVVGKKPLEPKAQTEQAEKTTAIVAEFLRQARSVLADEPKANITLLRGFARYHQYRTIQERFGLKSLALAVYPMYKGLSRLVGMDVHEGAKNLSETIAALKDNYREYDFFFLHYKNTDSRGEDGDFQGKVSAIEEVDACMPDVLSLNPDVLAITGDHSTPALLKGHSWHPVPVLIQSPTARQDMVKAFDEVSCASGILGRMESIHLMGLLLAHAGRLMKFGA